METPETDSEDLLPLAELHFSTERTARSMRDPDLNLLINLNEEWLSAPLAKRQEYVARVKVLDEALRAAGKALAADAYRELVKDLYDRFFQGVTGEIAEEGISLDTFKDLVNNHVAGSTIQKPHDSPHVGNGDVSREPDREVSLDLALLSDLEDDTSDTETGTSDALPAAEKFMEEENPLLAKLENAVEKGVKVLERLKQFYEKSATRMGDADWVTGITETIKHSEPAKVIIGVVGSTGSGKSSLINAIADEGNVLTTNCMRASTAVAAEISYNYGDSKYRADIEFIKPEEWRRELEILFSEIEDSKDDVPNGVPKDSEAAIALAKIKTVYPSLGQNDALHSSVDQLMGYETVTSLLGTTAVIEENDQKSFSAKLASYLDSNGDGKRKRRNQEKEPTNSEIANPMRLWPLIRVVRIYVKSAVLSTGAILVDLPGVFDSNAARVQVAEEYMKRCSAHWVVAPINRAVDDKVARDLLSKNFKTQMQMDCAFNDITFVCSKIDDISISETLESLGLDLQSARVQGEREEECENVTNELNKLNARKGKLAGNLAKLDDKIGKLEDLIGATGGDHLGKPTQLTPQKRKRPDGDDDDDQNMELESDSAPECPRNGENPPPEVEETARRKLTDFETRRRELQAKHAILMEQTETMQQKANQLRAEAISAQGNISRECVEARNDYATKCIKSDFATGICELGCEALKELGTPNAQRRDYSELERTLPVFCVSSRAYQKLRGRLRKDTVGVVFTKLEETGIPQLQKHCVALTQKAREASARRFLIELHQQLQSISIWATVADQSQMFLESEKKEVETEFNKEVAKFVDSAQSLLKELSSNIEEACSQYIFQNLPEAVKCGRQESVKAVRRWNGSGGEGVGFLFHTYRAFCRRNGVFKNMDWNQELAEPMLRRLAHSWAWTFDLEIRIHLDTFFEQVERSLLEFHQDAIALANYEVPRDTKEKLDLLLKTSRALFSQQVKLAKKTAKSRQKDASRLIPNAISEEMVPTYRACVGQRGRGALCRMRCTMAQGMDEKGEQMFGRAATDAYQDLMTICHSTHANLQAHLNHLTSDISRGHHVVIVEVQAKKLSREQTEIRRKVAAMVKEAEAELRLGELLENSES